MVNRAFALLALLLLAGCAAPEQSVTIEFTKSGGNDEVQVFEPGSHTDKKELDCDSAPTLDVDLTRTTGVVIVEIVDGAKTMVYREAFESNGKFSVTPEGQAGEYQLIVMRNDFGGSYEFSLTC